MEETGGNGEVCLGSLLVKLKLDLVKIHLFLISGVSLCRLVF